MRNLLLAPLLTLAVGFLPLVAVYAADESGDQPYRIETVADGLDYPWSIAFLPNGDYLVALRVGEVRRISAAGVVGEPLAGLAIYHGRAFPQWRGDLFVGALVDQEVRQLEMDGGRVTQETAIFTEIGERIRDIRVGLDDYLYILTDSDNGKVLRVVPD